MYDWYEYTYLNSMAHEIDANLYSSLYISMLIINSIWEERKLDFVQVKVLLTCQNTPLDSSRN